MNKKLLTVAIPCYNSQEYMSHCIESLLPGGECVEIIIVNDGSIDKTKEIADNYARTYPSIVKVVHQENGGHGEAVNSGIQNATGIYFKVVDSDDWVSSSAYKKILDTLEKLENEDTRIDMLISNFVYEKTGTQHKKVMRYHHVLPEDRIIEWEDVGHFHKGQYILMHSVIYRTGLLKECNLILPKHTFYVDNLFVYVPLSHVEKMYYLNVDFYRYFIGREDQSVNEKIMISRIDQQIRVNKLMLDQVDLRSIDNNRKRTYMYNYLEIITIVSTILLIRSGTKENQEKKKELWSYLKAKDIMLYYKLRHGIMGITMHLPGRAGRNVCLAAYKLSQKVIGFN
jgi:glycosyltransferase involved in cell wall biosynthesis